MSSAKSALTALLLLLLACFAGAQVPVLKSISVNHTIYGSQDGYAIIQVQPSNTEASTAMLRSGSALLTFKQDTASLPKEESQISVAFSTSPVVGATAVSIGAVGPSNAVYATVTIQPIQVVSLTVYGPTSYLTSASLDLVVNVSQPAGPAGVPVAVKTSQPWLTAPAQVIVPPYEDHVHFSAKANVPALQETASLTASIGPSNASQAIMSRGPTVTAVTVKPSEIPPGASSNATLFVSPPPAADIQVTLKSSLISGSSPDLIVPPTVTVKANQPSASFAFQVSSTAGVTSSPAVTAFYNNSQASGRVLVTAVFTLENAPPVTVAPDDITTVPVPYFFSAPTPPGFTLTTWSDNTVFVPVGGTADGSKHTFSVPANSRVYKVNFAASPVAASQMVHVMGKGPFDEISVEGEMAILAPQNNNFKLKPQFQYVGGKVIGYIQLKSPASATMTIELTGNKQLNLPASVEIPKGQIGVNFPFYPSDYMSTFSTVDYPASIQAKSTDGLFEAEATMVVFGANLADLSLNPYSVAAGQNSAITFTTDIKAPARTKSVAGGLGISTSWEGAGGNSTTLYPFDITIPPAETTVTGTIGNATSSDQTAVLAAGAADTTLKAMLPITLRVVDLSVPNQIESGTTVLGSYELNSATPSLLVRFSATQNVLYPQSSATASPKGTFKLTAFQVFAPTPVTVYAQVSGSPVLMSAQTTVVPLAPPTSLTATYGAGQVKLTWTQSTSHVTSYSVYRGTSAGTEVFLKRVDPGDSAIDETASPTQAYYYYVVAEYSGTSTLQSLPTPEVLLDLTPPEPPDFFFANSFTPGELELSWEASPSRFVTGYEISVTSPDGTAILTTNNTYITTPVSKTYGTLYSFAVKAKNSVGLLSSPASTTWTVPLSFDLITLTGATNGDTVDLQWTSAGDQAVSYMVVRDGVDLGMAYGTTYSDSTSPYANHSYTVVALDGSNNRGRPSNAYEYHAPLALKAFTISPATAAVGGTAITVTITLNGQAPSGGAVVDFSNGISVIPLPKSYTIAEGQTSATFKVTTGTVTAPESGTITAAYITTVSLEYTIDPPPEKH